MPTVEEMTEETYRKTVEAPLEERERPDIRKIQGRKPPKDGPCKRCGQERPLNRLFLCYQCWVKTVLEEKYGWREGMSHPGGCDCEVPNAHQKDHPGE